MTDDETAALAEQYGANIEWAKQPDEFHHIIKMTPPELRAMLSAKPVPSFQLNRDQFHDKVWAIYHQKAQGDSSLQKLSIHTVRMFANALYEAGCLPTARPHATGIH